MKKIYLLFLATVFLFSCARDNNEGTPGQGSEKEKGSVSFIVEGYNSITTKSVGNPGDPITDPVALDSLIKNIRILVFTPTSGNTCTAYADFDNLRLSLSNILEMTVAVGVHDFMILTNVLGPVMTTTSTASPTNPIGKTRAQILATLPTYTGTLSTEPANLLFGQPGHIFCDELDGINVLPDLVTKENVSLVRLISQLSTKIDKTQAFDATGVTPYATLIKNLERIVLRNSSPDINMLRLPNNRLGDNISASNIFLVGNGTWSATTTPGVEVSHTLAFPTEPVGLKPFVIIEAEVDPASPGYVADPLDATNHIRYWALQVPNKYLRENVILELTITKLKGSGKVTPATPGETSTCEFTIQAYDWDRVIDTDSGEAGS